jgi:hypothetical protein
MNVNVCLGIAEAPGAPSKPSVSDIYKDSCMLSWSAPSEDGGAPITGYHVERATSKASARWLRVTKAPSTDTSLKATDLIEDNEYVFRVIAENKVGAGPPGPESDPVLAKDPWGEYYTMHTRSTY